VPNDLPPPDPVAAVDVNSLSVYQAAEYRQELITAIMNPGIEYWEGDDDSRKIYKGKLAEVDAYLAALTGSAPGGNLP
jgi:hypothetical protein